MMLQGEESNAAANKCMLKVAQYAAQLENYPRAIEIYEQVSLHTQLLLAPTKKDAAPALKNFFLCYKDNAPRCNSKFCDKKVCK